MKTHRTQQTVGSLSVVAAQGWGPGTGKHWVTGFLRAQGSWDCGTRSGVDPAAHPPSPSLKLWREAEWDTILGRGGKLGLGGLCHLCEVKSFLHVMLGHVVYAVRTSWGMGTERQALRSHLPSSLSQEELLLRVNLEWTHGHSGHPTADPPDRTADSGLLLLLVCRLITEWVSFPFLCLELEDYHSNKLQHNSVIYSWILCSYFNFQRLIYVRLFEESCKVYVMKD